MVKNIQLADFIFMANVSLRYKIFHNLAPQSRKEFTKMCDEADIRLTLASTRGDCSVSFTQNCFSIKEALLPSTVRARSTLQQFRFDVENQDCRAIRTKRNC